jgi:hypothetical protein
MAISASSAAGFAAASQQAMQTSGHHKHGGHHSRSNTDIDSSGSSMTSAPSATGKVGGKLDVTA